MRNESRFRMVERADPASYKKFLADSQAAAERRYSVYQQLSGIKVPAFETVYQPAPPETPAVSDAAKPPAAKEP
jgi:hypothetical protein